MFHCEALSALALTSDTSVLTEIGVGHGYEKVFSPEFRGIARVGDVVLGVSTSGNSAALFPVFGVARATDVRTSGLTGAWGGKPLRVSGLTVFLTSLDVHANFAAGGGVINVDVLAIMPTGSLVERTGCYSQHC